MTKITAIVAMIELPKPCILPEIKIVAIAIKKGNLPIAGNKIICQNSNEPFSWWINDSTTNTTCSITTKSHAHGSDKMVVLESVNKRGVVNFVDAKIDVYFRLWNYPYAINTSNFKRRIWLWKKRKIYWESGWNLEKKN